MRVRVGVRGRRELHRLLGPPRRALAHRLRVVVDSCPGSGACRCRTKLMASFGDMPVRVSVRGRRELLRLLGQLSGAPAHRVRVVVDGRYGTAARRRRSRSRSDDRLRGLPDCVHLRGHRLVQRHIRQRAKPARDWVRVVVESCPGAAARRRRQRRRRARTYFRGLRNCVHLRGHRHLYRLVGQQSGVPAHRVRVVVDGHYGTAARRRRTKLMASFGDMPVRVSVRGHRELHRLLGEQSGAPAHRVRVVVDGHYGAAARRCWQRRRRGRTRFRGLPDGLCLRSHRLVHRRVGRRADAAGDRVRVVVDGHYGAAARRCWQRSQRTRTRFRGLCDGLCLRSRRLVHRRVGRRAGAAGDQVRLVVDGRRGTAARQ